MATPHNQASLGEIAKVVLMPGDPLRAKYIADHYLENVKQFNSTRNMFGYTGYYKGKKVSVMGSGMGIPSISIYATELYQEYGVETIIRVGTCGGLRADVHIRDIVIALGACSDSNFMHTFKLPGHFSAIASYDLLEKAVSIAKEKGYTYHVGNILSSDLFYHFDSDYVEKWSSMGVYGVEMEAYGLYALAAKFNKKALCISSVSDSLVSKEEISADERQTSLNEMIILSLEVASC